MERLRTRHVSEYNKKYVRKKVTNKLFYYRTTNKLLWAPRGVICEFTSRHVGPRSTLNYSKNQIDLKNARKTMSYYTV